MSQQLIIDLPDNLYERFQQASPAKREKIIKLVLQVLEEELSHRHADESEHNWSEQDEAMDREMQAYIAMHPMLKAQYFGKHVAVYQGQLIDMDDDFDALYERIDDRYPDQFVWMSQVKTEPIETIYNRTFRFMRQEATR